MVYGLEDFVRWRLPWPVEEGDPRDLTRGKYVILDDSARKRFGAFAVGDYREFYGRRLKIIGRIARGAVVHHQPDRVHGLPGRPVDGPAGAAERATYILVKLAPGADAERSVPRSAAVCRTTTSGPAPSGRHVRAPTGPTRTGLGLNMLMTVFLGCVVGVSVVAQTLYTSTIEHLKEFATVKAIGGRNADIYVMIAKQAAIAAVVGFALGAAMAYALRPAMAAVDLKLDVTPSVRRLGLRGNVGPVPRGLGDLVPEGRRARPGNGVPRVKDRGLRLSCVRRLYATEKRKGSDP